jgi:hypothetical protein
MSNSTSNDFRDVFLAGGISITLIIDVGIAAILLVLFALCVYRVPLFSTRRKRTLLDDAEKRRKELLIGGAIFGMAADSVAHMSFQNTRAQIGDGANVKVNNNLSTWLTGKAKSLWNFLRSLCGGTKNNVNTFGRDAATFLYFQQTFLVYAIVTMVMTIAILIPIHVTGNVPQIYDSQLCSTSLKYSPIPVPLSCISDPTMDSSNFVACSGSGSCSTDGKCACSGDSTGTYCQFKSCGTTVCTTNGACGEGVGFCPCVGK